MRGPGRDKRAHHDINKVDQGGREEVCATTDEMIFIPSQKPQAQGEVRFSDFHAPPCANFLRFSSAIDFGALLAHSVKTTILCPPCPRHAGAALRHARATLKSTV